MAEMSDVSVYVYSSIEWKEDREVAWTATMTTNKKSNQIFFMINADLLNMSQTNSE
jgi:hypothetical protein